jgi:hypothetical protein
MELTMLVIGKGYKKSTRSGPWTDNCVEVEYTKSTHSGNDGACVEMHEHQGEIHVRDSKDKTGPFLTFTPDEWRAFINGVKDDEFTIA